MPSEKEYIEQLQGVFGEYNASSERAGKDLITSAELLKKAVDSMESSLSFQNKQMQNIYKGALSKDTAYEKAKRELLEAKMQSKKTLDTLEKAVIEYQEAAKQEKDNSKKELLNEQTKFAQEMLNKQKLYDKELQMLKESDAYKKQQFNKLKNTAVNLLTNVANTIAREITSTFTNAYSEISSAYESSYGTITSYNSYSKADYNRVIDSLQKFISDKGLSKVVSVKDYMGEITSILQGGLTGELANMVAKYSVLSKEGGISADFSDQNFLKMVQRISDAGGDVENFLSNMMTQSKAVIDEVGNSFGFANGQINVMANSLYQLVDVTKMSDEAIKNSTASMTALSGVLGKTDFDSSKIFTMITDYATTGLVGTSNQAKLAFGMTQEEMQNLINTQGVGSAITQAMGTIYDQYQGTSNKGEFVADLTSALGGELTTKEVLSLLNSYGSKEEFVSAYQEAFEAANKSSEELYLDKLDDYQTQQEALTKVAENGVTDIVQVAETNGIIVQKGLNTIISLLGSQTLFGSDGLSKLANTKLFSDNSTIANSLLSGTKYGNKVLSSATVGGVATAGLSLAYGAYRMGKGASEGISLAEANDTSKVKGALGGAIGYSNIALSDDEKFKQAQQLDSKLGIDWSSVGSAAITGGAIGAGVGTIAAGWAAGSGTAIGAAVGAATGAVVNFTTQLIDMHDYAEFANGAIGEFTENLDDAGAEFNKITDSVTKYKSTFDELQDLQNTLSAHESNKIKLTDKEVAQLEAEIALKEKLLALEAAKLGNSKDIVDKTETLYSGLQQSNAISAAILEASKGINLSESEIKNMDDTELASYLSDASYNALMASGAIKEGTSHADVARNLLYGVSGTANGDDSIYTKSSGLNATALKGGITSAAYTNASTNIEKSASDGQTRLSNALSSLASFGDSYLSNDGDPNAIRTLLAEAGSAFVLAYGGNKSYTDTLNEFADTYGIENLLTGMSDKSISLYKDWLTSKSDATLPGYFRTGLNYVPYDNFPAILHKGERVQTAAEATAQRLSVTSQNSSMSTSLESVLKEQTTEIISILSKIYDAISGMNYSSNNQIKKLNYKLISNA